MSETPCFFPRALLDEMSALAVTLVTGFLADVEARASVEALVPARYQGPGQEAQPTCVQVDFGLVRTADGGLTPKLVELQAFPSLYAFQHVLAATHREVYELPPSLDAHLGGLDSSGYLALVRDVLVGRARPGRGRADGDRARGAEDAARLRAHRAALGHPDGGPARRRRPRPPPRPGGTAGARSPSGASSTASSPTSSSAPVTRLPFDYRDDLEVEWIGHPAWYFRLSKSAIPWLRHPAVPRAWRLDTIDAPPADPASLVLKPLFSFAGGGIRFAPTAEELAAVPADQRRFFLVQERVAFAPVIETPHGATQAEVRVMCLWTDRLRPVLPLIRMGRGQMMGVAHNQGLAWVGASAGFAADA